MSRLAAIALVVIAFSGPVAEAGPVCRVLSFPVRVIQRARPVRRALGCSKPARLQLHSCQCGDSCSCGVNCACGPAAQAPACTNGQCSILKK